MFDHDVTMRYVKLLIPILAAATIGLGVWILQEPSSPNQTVESTSQPALTDSPERGWVVYPFLVTTTTPELLPTDAGEQESAPGETSRREASREIEGEDAAPTSREQYLRMQALVNAAHAAFLAGEMTPGELRTRQEILDLAGVFVIPEERIEDAVAELQPLYEARLRTEAEIEAYENARQIGDPALADDELEYQRFREAELTLEIVKRVLTYPQHDETRERYSQSTINVTQRCEGIVERYHGRR